MIYRNNQEEWVGLKGLSSDQEMVDCCDTLYSKLPLIRKDIDLIFYQIQQCHDIQESADCFGKLDTICSELTRFVYLDEITISSDLMQFISDFDRVDDLSWREYIFNEIKFENYSLDGESLIDKRLR